MARSQRRREELESKYGNGAFAPIDGQYMEKARESSARYILFANKDNKHGYCERCCKDVEFNKTKHNEVKICPNCGAGLIVRHTWRGRCPWDIDWYVTGYVVDKETFALRYISVEQNDDYTKCVSESAREIYDFKHGWNYRFSYHNGGFHVDDKYCFQEFMMGGWTRKQCCIGALSIDNIKGKLKTLDAFKYFDKFNEYYGQYVYDRDNILMLLSVPLYEKLEKVGLRDIAQSDFKEYPYSYYGGYRHCGKRIKFKRSETSLTKMLGINKQQLKIVKKDGRIGILEFIKENKDMPLNVLDYLITNNLTQTYTWAKKYDEKPLKLTKYIHNNKVHTYEYESHLRMLEKLNYKLDDNYKYPKEFKKEHDRIIREHNRILDEEEAKRMGKQSKLIKEISDGLRKMPDLQEFLGGSNGLLVYVPESAKDLIAEGRNLHNCISSYVDRIAEGKTLVFFVRRLNAPNDPFVAFEYCNGEVIQCRYDYNEAVEDDKIISFVDAFAKRLRENNVLYKAA